MMVIQPEDMIGRTFLGIHLDNGEQHRARIVKCIDNHRDKVESNPQRIKFLCSFNNDQYEDIMSYNDIIDHIEKNEDDSGVWKLRHITAHEGPLATNSSRLQRIQVQCHDRVGDWGDHSRAIVYYCCR